MTLVETSRIQDLTITAWTEHRLLQSSATELVNHAMACGDALEELKTLVPKGQWGTWLKENRDKLGFHHTTAHYYMKAAANRELIEREGLNLFQAKTLLTKRTLGAPRGVTTEWGARNASKVKRAQEMKACGCSTKEIAAEVEMPEDTVRTWMRRENHNVRQQEKRARRRKEREVREYLERESIAQKAGVSDTYSQIRKVCQSLDNLYRNGSTTEIRAASEVALRHVHKAEDAFIKALKAPA